MRIDVRLALSFAPKIRIKKLRRLTAVAGIFAILLQAILFAWHHHAASFHVRFAGAAITLVAPTTPATPALADHDCEICFGLGHHGVVPVDLFVANQPEQAPVGKSPLAAVDTAPGPYILFRSRAPPSA